jgi:formylglycine-generating enzyme required for sulfatase activity
MPNYERIAVGCSGSRRTSESGPNRKSDDFRDNWPQRALTVAAVLVSSIVVGVLAGLTWWRDRQVAQALQTARTQPPTPKVVPPPDDQPPPPEDQKPAPWRPPGEDVTNSIGMKFKRIEAGTFMMPALQGVVPIKGIPAQKIPFREPFYLGVYLVTQQEYETVIGENPSLIQKSNAANLKSLPADTETKRFPVECVNWDDAQQFCAKLSALPAEKAAGRSYRMPTEWEWDYAARAGTSTTYIFGNDPAVGDDYGWFANNSGGRTHPVGLKKPNAWGLYDMQGNVWELCADPTYPPYNILRGVSWAGEAKNYPAAYRMSTDDDRYSTVGFRVVCLVGPPADLAPGNPPVELPPDNVDPISLAIAQLSSDDVYDQDAGCKLLAALKVDGQRQAEVVQAVRKMLDARERIRPRVQGIRALAVWGTAAEVPYLLRLLDDANLGVQEAAIVALGRLKDARAADMLASRLNAVWQRAAASEALKEIGPAAESAVRNQLYSTDNYARIEAIKILKVIGSPASRKDLIKLADDYYTDVAQAAREALPPELRPPVVDLKLCVTLNVHLADDRAWPALEAQIKALADSPNPMCKSRRQGDYLWVTLGPVNVDTATFARKIRFGKIVAVHPGHPGLIYVETGK